MNKFLNFIISEFKTFTLLLLFAFPFLSLLTFFLFISQSSETIFFLFFFLGYYYLSIIFSILVYIKIKRKNQNLRSCFEFIRRLNTTDNVNYWDEFKQPLKHLVGVEVGVLRGVHAEQLLKKLNFKKLYLVDPWKEYVDIISNEKLNNEEYERYFKEVKLKFAKKENVEIIRDFSIDAASKFNDNFLDFVYLDGDHSYEEVLKDLQTWYPKLKQFGVMCGDDYGHPSGVGVIKAVTEFSRNRKIVVHYGEDNQFWFVKV